MPGYLKYIICLLTACSMLTTHAQTVKQSVIASGGGSSNSISGYAIDFTIGETVIITGSPSQVITSATMACTQGFQQPLIAKDFPAASFTLYGAPKKSSILLEWTTSQEVDNAFFYIERSSNGIDFTVIVQVATKAPGGNSSTAILYQHTDLQPLNGNNYYRVRQVSKNGAINYSNTVLIPFTLPNWSVQAYPNPVKDIVTLKLYTSQKEQYVLRLVNIIGQVVVVQRVTAEQGYNNFTINMALLRKGMYILQVNNQAIKLLKE